MKLVQVDIHNFRCVTDASIQVDNYTLLVGANNAGKSNVLNSLRVFYEDIKWSQDDFPKTGAKDNESWVQLTFKLDDEEWVNLADKYKEGASNNNLKVRRYFKSESKDRTQKDQSNIFGFINSELDKELFYGAKNIGSAKLGSVIYIPALTTSAEQTKMSGPSPLRNMLNFLIKKVVAKSDTYKEIEKAFEKFNDDSRKKDGFLSEVSEPLNKAISAWNIQIDLSVNSVAPEDITKSLIRFAFVDTELSEHAMSLDQYGHGFQRSVIYELIRLAPTFKEEKKPVKKEFSPDFTLILFEEPESFLHPSQQENMAYHLRRIAREKDQQVIITTHSPIFVGKAAEEIGQLVRICRINGIARIFQPKGGEIRKIFEQGGELLKALKLFVEDASIPANKKKEASQMILNPPVDEIAIQEEQFRYQLWLDGERSALFFADKVLLVEGASERALFNYLLANDWHELISHRIIIIDVFGKYNFHRYMALLEAYGIAHGVILDDDNSKNHHGAINELIDSSMNPYTLEAPVQIKGCLEDFLGIPRCNRQDKKPVEIMKAVTGSQIEPKKLKALQVLFCKSLKL